MKYASLNKAVSNCRLERQTDNWDEERSVGVCNGGGGQSWNPTTFGFFTPVSPPNTIALYLFSIT